MSDTYDLDAAWYELGGTEYCWACDDRMRYLVAYALTKLPEDLRERLLAEVYIASPGGANAEYVHRDVIGSRALILLSPEAAQADAGPVTLLHEVAHHFLGHKAPHLREPDAARSRAMYDQQETEAWLLAHKWNGTTWDGSLP